MSVATNITSELTALQAQLAAARPLQNASAATLKALQLNAGNLVSDIQNALTAPSTLDTWSVPADAASIVIGFNSVVVAAADQASLSLMRGLTGRALANLELA